MSETRELSLEEANDLILRQMAEDIRIAHEINPASWAVREYESNLRLYVEQLLVLTAVSPELANKGGREVSVLVSVESLRDRASDPWIHLRNAKQFYENRSWRYLYLPERDMDIWQDLRSAHEEMVRILASGVRRNTARATEHQPEFVRLIEERTGIELPDPDYGYSVETGHEVTRRYWKITAGQDASEWTNFLDKSVVAIGYSEYDDPPSSYANKSELARYYQERAQEMADPRKDFSHATDSMWKFTREMRVGDVVVVPKTNKMIVGIAEIIGEFYSQHDEFRYRHRRNVRWLVNEPVLEERLSAALKSKLGTQTPVLELKDDIAAEIDALIRESTGEGVRHQAAQVTDVLGPMDVHRAVQGMGLHYGRDQVLSFYTALQTKGFVVLSGISGTGKSKIAQGFVELLPQPVGDDSIHLFLSVRPDWRDSRALIGYHNPLLNQYEWTDFLRFVLRAADNYRGPEDERIAWFVILDEMNLAHVEYYFADLLSVLESGRDTDGFTREAIRIQRPEPEEGQEADVPPAEIRLPPNLFIIGTVNMDETTHAFSPKVLDRAFTLELSDVSFADYPPTTSIAPEITDRARRALLADFSRGGRFVGIDKDDVRQVAADFPALKTWLETLNQALARTRSHFGYRVFDEIAVFLGLGMTNFPDATFAHVLDHAVLMKILPKFSGSAARIERPLLELLAWCVNPDQPNVAQMRAIHEDLATSDAMIDALVTRLTAAVIVTPPDLDVEARVAPPAIVLPITARRVAQMLDALREDGFASFG